MRPIATDGVAWFIDLSVGLSVTTALQTKTDEPIEMPFGCGLEWVQLGLTAY